MIGRNREANMQLWRSLAKFGLLHSILVFLFTNSLLAVLWPPRGPLPEQVLWLLPVLLAMFGWAMLFAAIGRILRWSRRTCLLCPLVLFFTAQTLLLVWHSNFVMGGVGLTVGYLCRKLVYPDRSWSEPDLSQEPITLFSGH